MEIFHQNIRGIEANLTSLQEFFCSFPKIDILTLSETHVSNKSDNEYKNYEIEHYDFISKCRVNGKGGEVGIYIANKLNWIRRSDLELKGITYIWIKIIIEKSSNILVSSIYRPPESSEYLSKNFNNLFSDMLMKLSIENKKSIILGEINANYLDKKKNIDLKNTLKTNGIKQVIEKATCVTKDSSTLLDIIASNKPNNISHCDTIPASLSDHDMVGCVRKLHHFKYNANIITCRNFSNYDQHALCNELQYHDWKPLYNTNNVNNAWNYFKNVLKTAFDDHAPYIKKKIKGKPCPWLTSAIKSSMNERDNLLRISRRQNTEKKWIAYKRSRNHCTNLIRIAKENYWKEVLKENANNPKSFWKSVKSIVSIKPSKGNSISSPFIEDKSVPIKSSVPKEKVEIFCSFFTSSGMLNMWILFH